LDISNEPQNGKLKEVNKHNTQTPMISGKADGTLHMILPLLCWSLFTHSTEVNSAIKHGRKLPVLLQFHFLED
jgi:hypothetical protein